MKNKRGIGIFRIDVLRLVVPVLFSLIWATAQGEIYKWVDESGRVQFSDRPPAGWAAEQVELGTINTYQGASVEDGAGEVSDSRKPVRRRGVVMYSASWCGVCTRARRFFRDQGIPFRERDIEQDESARREFDRMNGSGVPIILVGGKRMNGFSERRFMDLYAP